MNEVLISVLAAKIDQGATEEAIRQISTGTISGDWVFWTFPCMESKLKNVLFMQSDVEPNYEERFQKLNQYALKDRKDAERYLSNPTLRRNLECVCSALLDYNIDYVWRVFNQWLSFYGPVCQLLNICVRNVTCSTSFANDCSLTIRTWYR